MNFSPVPFRPRICVNSFPKSGTNLATLFVRYIVRTHDNLDDQWLSASDAWTNEMIDVSELRRGLALLSPGFYVQGHSAFTTEHSEAFLQSAVCKMFVYRDLRDVAVSQAYHIEDNDDDRFRHPGKSAYAGMSHDEVLRAVIRGIDGYPGIGARWFSYMLWLKQDWVYPIRYEDMIMYPELVFDDMLTYLLARGITDTDYIPLLSKRNIENIKKRTLALVESSMPKHSPTLRQGKPGAWKNEFDKQTKKLFKHYCGQYLIQQGYEIDERW